MTAIPRRLGSFEAVSTAEFEREIFGNGYFDALPQIEINPRRAEVRAFCRDHIVHHKAPKALMVCTLPKTATGKILKFILTGMPRQTGPQA